MSYGLETLFVLLNVTEFEEVRDNKKNCWGSYDTMI